MKTSVALVQAQDYEQKKASAMEAGLHGERVVVFTEEELLTRWVSSLGVRPESLESQRYRLERA